jgi:hypothetical protein
MRNRNLAQIVLFEFYFSSLSVGVKPPSAVQGDTGGGAVRFICDKSTAMRDPAR